MKVTISRLIRVLSYFILIAYPSIALGAQEANSSGGFRAYGAFGLLIAYLTRKSAIGGWLLMYYFATYGGVLFTLGMTIATLNNFNPNNYADVTHYVMVMSDVTISTALILGTAIVSTALLMKKCRGLRVFSLLKQFLLGSLIMSLLSVGVDLIYQLWDSIPLDIYGLIVSAIWYFYIVRSVRVEHVFVLQDFKLWYPISHPAKQAVG
jgi:hypothetical protein